MALNDSACGGDLDFVMSRLPKFANDVSNHTGAKDGEFKLGPLSCFVLGFVAGIAAIVVFGDMNILRYYIITAFR